MLEQKFKSLLLDQELGLGRLGPIETQSLIKHQFSVRESFNPVQFLDKPMRKSSITYIAGKEDCLVCLTSNGAVIHHTTLAPRVSQMLTKPHEKAIKIFLQSGDLYMILIKSDRLRFYSVDLVTFQRRRMLKHSNFLPTDLKKVDPLLKYLVIESHANYSIWDLDTESCLFTCEKAERRSIWYSKNTVIQSDSSEEGVTLKITSLDTNLSKFIKVRGLSELFQVEKVGEKLVIGSSRKPIQIIDLQRESCEALSMSPPVYYLETIKMKEPFVMFADGQGKFIGSRSFNIRCKKPLFTDTSEEMFIIDGSGVFRVSEEGVAMSAVNLGKKITSVGVNEDTMELYVGHGNGTITILQ